MEPGRNRLHGEEGFEKRLSLSDVLQDAFVCGLIALDTSRKIQAINAPAERITGLAAARVVGQPCELLGRPLAQILEESLGNRVNITNRQVELPSTGKPSLVVSTMVAFDSAPGGWALVAVLNELTTAFKLEWSIRRLNRLASMGTLSASVAHEIKNALVAIKTFVDALKKEDQDTGLAEIVTREIQRISSIVGQMLKFSGAATPTLAEVQVHDVLEQSLRLVQYQISEKQIRVQRDFEATPDAVKGDTYQLEQVFVNLFLNALAAMDPGGELRVATETLSSNIVEQYQELDSSRRWLRVQIADTGTGITPEVMERLFEPFVTTKLEGTGLGLSITRRIVREHGGFIAVESQVHKGTTFSILLPTTEP